MGSGGGTAVERETDRMRFLRQMSKIICDFNILETILDKGIMPSEKVLDFPVDCNTLTGSVNL